MNNLEAASTRSLFYNIIDYGAVDDGSTVNTKCIQKAIDDCANNGGGTVYFPAGTFISGTLCLKSYVNLHLEAGAILRGSKDLSDYPVTNSPGVLSTGRA
ncbi:glycosyl hydrolase family 28-related protein [Verrucomicrobiota bacterium]